MPVVFFIKLFHLNILTSDMQEIVFMTNEIVASHACHLTINDMETLSP